MPRGQVTSEGILALILLMFLLMFVMGETGLRSQQLDFWESSGIQKTECIALQHAFSSVQSVPENSQLELTISNDFNLVGNSIDFSDFYCYFDGNPLNEKCHKGVVRVRKVDGNVVVEKADGTACI